MRSITLALTLLASISLAQQKKPAPKVQTVELTGTEVTAGRAIPIGEIYFHPPKAVFAPLIQVRMNMNDKLRESVHEM